ncbi:MAG: hypothetical protein LBV12_06990, partial [Puniceicoccales bacterium]|nr:hypothetical protein [Puniceicoccales bacterium]
QRGVLLVPGGVYTFVHEKIDSNTPKKRVFIKDNSEPVFKKKVKQATELKVAQWFYPIRRYDRDTQEIEFNEDEFLDPDAFFFRIKAPPPPSGEKYRVKVWTTDCPNSEYNDFGEEVELYPVGNDTYQTKPLYLVSDKRDTRYPLEAFMEDTGEKDDQGKTIREFRRRAFCVQLGGQVKFQFLGLAPDGDKPDRVLPVPVKKVVKVSGLVFHDSHKGTAEFQLKRARERYAQCGIRLDGSVKVGTAPAGVNIDPLNVVVSRILQTDAHTLGPEVVQFFNALSGASGVIPFYCLDYLMNQSIIDDGGAFYPAWLSDTYHAYANRILLRYSSLAPEFTNVNNQDYLSYSLGHEILHILLNGGHSTLPERQDSPAIKYTDDFGLKIHCLWSYGFGIRGIPDIVETKRISDEMMHELLQSPFCQEP